ncbi:TPA: hypothetical protein DCP77_04170 [Candidatus Collierbacteria bacterium]|nr:hypothetical protein [Candidatus Collierbacteria bacterium]HAN22939.1 hypothetical protein [Candidatus Collierbacteria bacterium]HAS69368.1 hypothetical protein [Candidatus Collierbacteria bacterium]HBX64196.1 hypothetical protein [Candidatus Collierbacteria bacterium]HCW31800.1 hypothetical protein [Candidatus Collierbacteria bacterium]
MNIVCRDAEILVLVEVKTKIEHDFGERKKRVNKK